MANITQQTNHWNVSGELLINNVNKLLDLSASLVMKEDTVIDFSAVTDVDTSTLSLMLEWLRRAEAANCKVSFSHISANLISLAELYGVTEFIPTINA